MLGVSMTGMFSNKLFTFGYGKEVTERTLEALKSVAVAANRDESARIGIQQSAAVTCVKPEGTTSHEGLCKPRRARLAQRFLHSYCSWCKVRPSDSIYDGRRFLL